jgi:UDP-2-acetamido-3-amino-2,3-dideoxy-glucuronate N-acetyltransferase
MDSQPVDEPFISSHAIVEEGAKIGKRTKVWHFAQVRSGSIIGEDCVIGKDVYIDTGVVIGNRVKIQNGVSIYSGCTVEDDVFLGPSCVTTNDLTPRSFIPDYKKLPTLFRKGCSVGAGAVIVCGNTLGEYCMVGAGSVVTHHVPPYCLVMGNPAKIVGVVCKNGHAQSIESAKALCSICGDPIVLQAIAEK